MSRKVAAMLRGAVATCSLMPMPVVNSAASALTTPIMASLLLMVSGAAHNRNPFNINSRGWDILQAEPRPAQSSIHVKVIDRLRKYSPTPSNAWMDVKGCSLAGVFALLSAFSLDRFPASMF